MYLVKVWFGLDFVQNDVCIPIQTAFYWFTIISASPIKPVIIDLTKYNQVDFDCVLSHRLTSSVFFGIFSLYGFEE
jgi:hypothetical protein